LTLNTLTITGGRGSSSFFYSASVSVVVVTYASEEVFDFVTVSSSKNLINLYLDYGKSNFSYSKNLIKAFVKSSLSSMGPLYLKKLGFLNILDYLS